jgi:ribosomal-protein-serine acetyltransferase
VNEYKKVKIIFKHIINNKLELRLLETYHADTIYQVIEQNREYLSEWFPWVKNTLNAEHSKAFIEFELRRFANNNGFSAGIFYNDQYVGNISIHEINWNAKMTSLGYWLSAEHQGIGIMTTCCREKLTYGFEILGLNKIEIRARTDNEKSRAIPVRLGFKEEGILRQVEFNNNR